MQNCRWHSVNCRLKSALLKELDTVCQKQNLKVNAGKSKSSNCYLQRLDIDETEDKLPRQTLRILAKLWANKSPILLSYLNHIYPTSHPSPLCPLCEVAEHDTIHFLNCHYIRTVLDPDSLWLNHVEATALLDQSTAALTEAQ